jgi:hypothetical protein
MPKAISSFLSQQYTRTMAVILSLSKIISPLYSCYTKEGLVYITIAAPSS